MATKAVQHGTVSAKLIGRIAAARCHRNRQLTCRQGRFPVTLLVLYRFRRRYSWRKLRSNWNRL